MPRMEVKLLVNAALVKELEDSQSNIFRDASTQTIAN